MSEKFHFCDSVYIKVLFTPYLWKQLLNVNKLAHKQYFDKLQYKLTLVPLSKSHKIM